MTLITLSPAAVCEKKKEDRESHRSILAVFYRSIVSDWHQENRIKVTNEEITCSGSPPRYFLVDIFFRRFRKRQKAFNWQDYTIIRTTSSPSRQSDCGVPSQWWSGVGELDNSASGKVISYDSLGSSLLERAAGILGARVTTDFAYYLATHEVVRVHGFRIIDFT
ncbi:hypothetical protein J6590_062602 [Homalodisca vitripennis]|nr:hypothetical protein J6590_062602 [Homalodisca vitripennis]